MEKKKLQSVSIAALIVSILPLAALAPSLLHFSLSAGIRTAWAGANIVFAPFSGMCAEQGKPQHYQYRIHSDQRFLGTADGGNRCTCLVPYFRSMRKRLCVKLEKLLDAV